jgi:hypothetical protein
MIVQINIGLNNNPYNFEQIFNHMASLREQKLLGACEYVSEYIDNPEPTFVGKFEVPDNTDIRVLIKWMEVLSDTYTQECIPFTSPIGDLLVYNRSWIGDRYKFDARYFVTLEQVQAQAKNTWAKISSAISYLETNGYEVHKVN